MNVEQLDGFFAALIPQVFHALDYCVLWNT
jgi:hypothetical protein